MTMEYSWAAPALSATPRVLSESDIEAVAGGQSLYPANEAAVDASFDKDGAIEINSLWSMEKTGEFYHDSDGNGKFDEIYEQIDQDNDGQMDSWLRSTDAQHWHWTDKPNWHDDTPEPTEEEKKRLIQP